MVRLRKITVLALCLLAAVPAAAAARSPEAFSHLGTWVDRFDTPVYSDLQTSITEMKSEGVHTIYVQTADTDSAPFARVGGIGRLIEAAHDSGMKVVAWTLPGHAHPADDRKKAMAAVTFHSRRGDRFDGFALDIESTDVKKISKRNKRMINLSKEIKAWTKGVMPIGAITYSPVFINGPWPKFPWKSLAKIYRIFMPMAYSSYHYNSSHKVRSYTEKTVKLLRQKTSPHKPIHVIGGIGDQIAPHEARGFVRGVKDSHVAGGSLYDFLTTNNGDWKYLRQLH